MEMLYLERSILTGKVRITGHMCRLSHIAREARSQVELTVIISGLHVVFLNKTNNRSMGSKGVDQYWLYSCYTFRRS
jgi:hypothetical protein